jgi:hypothetical protein
MARDRVLDENHGIERRSIDKITYGTKGTTSETEVMYLPWYRKETGSYYYTSNNGWVRAEHSSFESAFNHIARSRKMLKSTDPHSSFQREQEEWAESGENQ